MQYQEERYSFNHYLGWRAMVPITVKSATFPGFNNTHDIHHIPKFMHNPGPHYRGNLERHMNLAEVVIHEVQRNRVSVILRTISLVANSMKAGA